MIPFPIAAAGFVSTAGSIVQNKRAPRGDMQSGVDRRALAGDMNSGSDVRKTQEVL